MTLKLIKQAGTMVLASTLLLTAAPGVWADEVCCRKHVHCHPLHFPEKMISSWMPKLPKNKPLNELRPT